MQLVLAYDAAHAGADDWTDLLKWFRLAVEICGHKEVAYKLDIAPSQLTDAMLERERKDVKAKWFPIVARMCPESIARQYVDIVNRQAGYDAPTRKRVRTPDEELREVREILKREAPGLLSLVEKELGR